MSLTQSDVSAERGSRFGTLASERPEPEFQLQLLKPSRPGYVYLPLPASILSLSLSAAATA